jgi:hypothetical protein
MFTGRAAMPPPGTCSVTDYGNSFNPDSLEREENGARDNSLASGGLEKKVPDTIFAPFSLMTDTIFADDTIFAATIFVCGLFGEPERWRGVKVGAKALRPPLRRGRAHRHLASVGRAAVGLLSWMSETNKVL